jgi:predicted Zn-dependent protease
MSLPTKEELGAKLMEYPLLRQLLYERWFRLAFTALVLVFVSMALFLPKIWRSSARGFLPVIKVSGLDLVQAWSLKRTALKEQAAGRYDEANYAWQSALANNRADADLVRGALRNILQDPHIRKRGGHAIQEAFWLLKLTGTNIADLELAADVLERFRYYEPILAMIEPKVSQITPALAAIYLKTLFNEGHMAAFDARWEEFKRLPLNDPELPVYRAAYLIGWGSTDMVADARRRLDAATDDPALRILAYRLKLVLATQQLNVSDYAQALKRLEEFREDTLHYHVAYWRLLLQTGQRAQAIELASSYPHRPTSAVEVVELAQVYSELGRRDQALELLQNYTKEFSHAAIFWVTYATELLETKRWEDLRAVALQIRSEDNVRDVLSGFSYFLEGRAELALGREASAIAAFKKSVEREFPFPGIGQRVAGQLLQLGQPALARELLMSLKKPLHAQLSYWILCFRVAELLKDVDFMLASARQAYELNPNDPYAVNNYAAALLITRQNPEQAIKLSLPFYSQNPNLLHAVVNHSAALLLNGRPQEAKSLLERIPTNALDRTQLALYNLDLFETYLRLNRFDLARAVSDRIDPDRLYPNQREWLQKARQDLPPLADSPSSTP